MIIIKADSNTFGGNLEVLIARTLGRVEHRLGPQVVYFYFFSPELHEVKQWWSSKHSLPLSLSLKALSFQ